MRALKDCSNNVDSKAQFLMLLPSMLINSVIYLWIFMDVSRTLSQIREERNRRKTRYFLAFMFSLISIVLLSVFVVIAQMVVNWRSFLDGIWKVYWVFEAYWQFTSFLLLSILAFIWRPSKNNLRWLLEGQNQHQQNAEDNDSSAEIIEDEEGDVIQLDESIELHALNGNLQSFVSNKLAVSLGSSSSFSNKSTCCVTSLKSCL